MRKLVILILVLIVLLNFHIASSVFASTKKPAYLKADELVYKTDYITGYGNVIFDYEDIKVTSNIFRLDNDTHNITFEDDVKIYQDDMYSQAHIAFYTAADGKIILTDGLTEFIGDFLKEPAYVRGKEIIIHDKTTYISEGSVTTCDLDEPHYQIKAESIDIYFGERILLRNIHYYEGSFRLFFFPFLVIPIGERAHFEFPQIGTSYEEGFFVKTRYNYYFSPQSQGLIYLDYMERKGLGLGVRHLYDIFAGTGSIYLYTILSRDLTLNYDDFEMEIEHSYEISDKARISGGFAKDRYISANFGAEWELPGSSWSSQLDYDHIPHLSYFERFKGSLSVYQELWDTVNITSNTTLTSNQLNHRGSIRYSSDAVRWTLTNNLRAESKPQMDPAITSSYTHFSGNILDGRITLNNNYRFNPQTQVTPSSTGYLSLFYPLSNMLDINFQANRYDNYDRDRLILSGRYNDINWSLTTEDTESKKGQLFLDRSPEISIRTPSLSLGPLELPLGLDIKYGHLIEKPTMKESDRTDITANYRSDVINLSKNNTLRINSYIRYSNYDNISERLATNFQGVLTTDLLGYLTFRNTYTNRQVLGRSPFESDRITHEHSILSNVDMSFNSLSFSMNGKYDIPTETMGTITSTIDYRFDARNNISLTADYEPLLDTFKKASLITRTAIGQYLTATNTIRYDLLKDETEYLSTNIRASIREDWSANYYHRLTTHGDKISTKRANISGPFFSLFGSITENHTRDSITHLRIGGEVSLLDSYYLSYEETLDKTEIRIEADLFAGWSGKVDRVIDAAGISDSLVLIKDLHCREVRFFYETKPQAFWFEYRINALDFSYFTD